MPVQIVRNDITKMHVDAIVNAANNRLANGGGVCGAIHAAAGPQLLDECMTLGGCKTGDAKITGGYLLPARYVIHTVGPVWRGGTYGEREALVSCYCRSLELAKAHGCESIAFPLISSGIYGYPKDQALKVAMDTISSFLISDDDTDMTVYLVVFSKSALQISSKLFTGIRQYIDDAYADAHADWRRGRSRAVMDWERRWEEAEMAAARPAPLCAMPEDSLFEESVCAPLSLEEALGQIDESFSQMVLRKIKEKGMKNSECYKKANLDKKLFSKINNDIHYKPKKQTALALAVALELDLDETRELLTKAGLALTHSEKFDIIVEYFIANGKYNVFDINEVLFYYDQPLLGAVML